MRSLIWFRADLRVGDNTALHHGTRAATQGVVAVFTICPDQWAAHDWADVKVDFILRTLETLRADLLRLNIPLLVRTVATFDEVPDVLVDVARRHQCDTLFFNREYEVNERRRDRAVSMRFEAEGLGVHAFTDQVVLPPGALRTGRGSFYTVFTPYRRAWQARVEAGGVPTALSRPRRLARP